MPISAGGVARWGVTCQWRLAAEHGQGKQPSRFAGRPGLGFVRKTLGLRHASGQALCVCGGQLPS